MGCTGIHKGRGNELLLCVAVLRHPLWHTPYVRVAYPRGFDLSGTVGVVALNFIVGGLIGGVILIWRLAVAAWYIPLTIYRLLNVGRVGVAEIDEE